MCIHALCNNNRVVRILRQRGRACVRAAVVYLTSGDAGNEPIKRTSAHLRKHFLPFQPHLPLALLRILRTFVTDYSAFRVALKHEVRLQWKHAVL